MEHRRLLITTALLGTFSYQSSASEVKISPEIRVDLRSQTVKEEGTDSETSTNFRLARGRLNFRGKVNEQLSYRLRIRMSRFSRDDGADSGVSQAVDYAYIDAKLSDAFKLRLGKMFVPSGAQENYYSGMDQYFYSRLYNGDYDVLALPGYSMGIAGVFEFGDHSLQLTLINPPEAEERFDGQKGEIDFAQMGLTAQAHLSFGSVESLISVANIPKRIAETDTLKDDKAALTHAALGFAVRPGDVDLEVEYGMVSTPEYDRINGDGTGKETVVKQEADTVVALARYTMDDSIKPWVKLTSGNHKVDGKNSEKSTGYGVGVEYFPYEKINYRYHLAYTSQKVKPEGGKETTTSQFILGVAGNL